MSKNSPIFVLHGGQDLLARGIADFSTLRPVLAANADPLTANATLRKDEWETIDERVNEVLRERLTVVDDLRGRGLVQSVSIGSLLRVTERLSDFDEAEVSFDGDTDPTSDRPNFEKDIVPVPVVAKDFRLNWRQLAASRERGDPLDTTGAELAARKVRDRLQKLITRGLAAGGPTGGGIPGLTTAQRRITVSLSTPWDQSAADPVGDTLAMLDAAYAANLFGPFYLYIPKNWWAAIQDDQTHAVGGGGTVVLPRTVRERLLAFEDIAAVRPNDALPDDEAVLVQMTRDVIDLSEAQVVTTVQWERNPFVTMFRVLTVAGPQIKSIETSDGQTVNGIVHLA